MDKKIAVVSQYPVEISPVVMGLCSYLAENMTAPLDVYTSALIYSQDFSSDNLNIIQLKPKSLRGDFVQVLDSEPWSWIRNRVRYNLAAIKNKFAERVIVNSLKLFRGKHDVVFCVEASSLLWLFKAGFDLSKVVYVSLEGFDILSQKMGRDVASELLGKCMFSLVASKERHEDLEKELGSKVDALYLPVSIRPIPYVYTRRSEHIKLRLIHSGYFSEWSCLLEFIDAFEKSGMSEKAELYLQGHAVGTEPYLSKLKERIKGVSSITLDTAHYSYKEHRKLLADHDIGLALYKNIRGTANWDNLIFSSGKIACCLWAGLGVLTNVTSSLAEEPPFLQVNDINESEIRNVLDRYMSDQKIYHDSAHKTAEKYYNLDKHMDKIMERIG